MARVSLEQLYVQLYEDEKDIISELPKVMKSQRLNKRELVIEAIRYYIHAINEGKAGFQPFMSYPLPEPEIKEDIQINEKPRQEEVVKTETTQTVITHERDDLFGDINA